MTFTPELLASGQLASSKGTTYEVPAGMRAIVDHIAYYNTSGGSLTCRTYVNNGTSRQIHSASVAASQRHIVIDNTAPLYLDSGHLMEGDAGSATSVNYFIFGKLEQKGAA